MNFDSQTTNETLLSSAQDALAVLEETDDIQIATEAAKTIAQVQYLLISSYEEKQQQILAPVKQQLEALKEEYTALPINDIADDAKVALRRLVIDYGQSIADGDWLRISYVKPTLKLTSVERLIGFTIDNPEARQLLLTTTNPSSRVAKWEPQNASIRS